MKTSRIIAVDTSLGTRFLLSASLDSTVSDLRGLIQKEHIACFPDLGLVHVGSLIVEYNHKEYHVTNSLLVGQLFKRSWNKVYAQASQTCPKSISNDYKHENFVDGEARNMCLVLDAAVQCENLSIERQTSNKHSVQRSPSDVNGVDLTLVEIAKSHGLNSTEKCVDPQGNVEYPFLSMEALHPQPSSQLESAQLSDSGRRMLEKKRKRQKSKKNSQKDGLRAEKRKYMEEYTATNGRGKLIVDNIEIPHIRSGDDTVEGDIYLQLEGNQGVAYEDERRALSSTKTFHLNVRDVNCGHEPKGMGDSINASTIREPRNISNTDNADTDTELQIVHSNAHNALKENESQSVSDNDEQEEACKTAEEVFDANNNEDEFLNLQKNMTDRNSEDATNKTGLDVVLCPEDSDFMKGNEEGTREASVENIMKGCEWDKAREYPIRLNDHSILLVTSLSADIVPETQESEMNTLSALNEENHEDMDDNESMKCDKDLPQVCIVPNANSDEESENDKKHYEKQNVIEANICTQGEDAADLQQEDKLVENAKGILMDTSQDCDNEEKQGLSEDKNVVSMDVKRHHDNDDLAEERNMVNVDLKIQNEGHCQEFILVQSGGHTDSKNCNNPEELFTNEEVEPHAKICFTTFEPSNNIENITELECGDRNQTRIDDKVSAKKKKGKRRKVSEMRDSSKSSNRILENQQQETIPSPDCKEIPDVSTEVKVELSSRNDVQGNNCKQGESPLKMDTISHGSPDVRSGDIGNSRSKRRKMNLLKQPKEFDAEVECRVKDNLRGKQSKSLNHVTKENLEKEIFSNVEANCETLTDTAPKKKKKKTKHKKKSSLNQDIEEGLGRHSIHEDIPEKHTNQNEINESKESWGQEIEGDTYMDASKLKNQDISVEGKRKKGLKSKKKLLANMDIDVSLSTDHANVKDTGSPHQEGFDEFEFHSTETGTEETSYIEGVNDKGRLDLDRLCSNITDSAEKENLNTSSRKTARKSVHPKRWITVLSGRLNPSPKSKSKKDTLSTASLTPNAETGVDEMGSDDDNTEEKKSSHVMSEDGQFLCPYGCGKTYSKKTSSYYRHRRGCKG